MLDDKPLVSIEKLRVEFETNDGVVVGVKDVSFNIKPGECVCVVGESGSGKSVSSLSLMRLVEFGGGTIAGGQLMFEQDDGKVVDLARQNSAAMRDIRGNQIGMIFQEPMTALNPVFTVGDQLVEGLFTHRGLKKAEARARALEILRQVRIPEPERRLDQYPHELSGGMRQRVVIAIAMACEPRLLICDEPTTALDVTIQAEILALIDRLKREKQIAVLFITHDMAVVAQMADRVVVMYRGEKVEEGPVEQIFENPQRDYTKMLLAAVPRLGEMTGKAAPERLRLMSDGSTGAPEPIVVANPHAAADGQEPDHAVQGQGRPAAPHRRAGARGRGCQLYHQRRRDAVAGGRIRLWQVHLRAVDPAPGRARIGHGRPGWHRHHRPVGERAAKGAARHADDLSGPVRQP